MEVKLFVLVTKFPRQIGLYHLRGINFNKIKHNIDFHSRILLNTGILARKSQRQSCTSTIWTRKTFPT